MLSQVLVALTLFAGLCAASPFYTRDTASANFTFATAGGPMDAVAASTICAGNLSVFLVDSTTLIPNTSVEDVWSLTGDFYNLTWVDSTIVNTTGPDNFPGALRTFNEGGTLYTERLVFTLAVLSPQAFPGFNTSHGWPYFAQAFSSIGSLSADGLYATNVTNWLASYPKGDGSVFEWSSTGCSNDSTLAEKVFEAQHVVGLNQTFVYLT